MTTAAPNHALLAKVAEAWSACKGGGALSKELMDRIVDAQEDPTRVSHDDPVDFEPGLAGVLIEIASRGDELSNDALTGLMAIMRRPLIGRGRTRHHTAKETGFLSAVFGLCKKYPKYIVPAIGFLGYTLWNRADCVALIQESRDNDADLTQLIDDYLLLPYAADDKSADAVLGFTRRLLTDGVMPELQDVRVLLSAVKRYSKREDLSDEVMEHCNMLIQCFCMSLRPPIPPGLEPILLEVGLFRPPFKLLISNATAFSYSIFPYICDLPELLCDVLETSGVVEEIVNAIRENGNQASVAYRHLHDIASCANDSCLDKLVSDPRIRSNLLDPHGLDDRGDGYQVIRTLLKRYAACPRTIEDNWPLLQLHFIHYLDCSKTDPRMDEITDATLYFMRANPMAIWVKELKELPINGLIFRLLEPQAKAIKKMLQEARFEEKALDVAWLAFAIGFQFERDEHGKVRDVLEGSYPDERSRNRIRGMHVIVWALGIATLDRFHSTANKSQPWLSSDLWQMVWQAIYE